MGKILIDLQRTEQHQGWNQKGPELFPNLRGDRDLVARDGPGGLVAEFAHDMPSGLINSRPRAYATGRQLRRSLSWFPVL